MIRSSIRPTVILPGYFAGATPYAALEQFLNQQGIPTVTVPLTRSDWFPTLGGQPVTPILKKLAATIDRHSPAGERINLIGHSAGGWIGRIYLGDQPYPDSSIGAAKIWQGRDRVSTLLSLGTPHLSQERWTKRNINFVNDTYPGAFYPDVRYVCIAGRSIYGDRGWRKGWTANLAYNSYDLTCGQGASWGDGITPVEAAHLKGAINLTLEGVVHSPGSAQSWYGSETIVAQWQSYL
ncbi:MAG: esterase/lipase family protein [Prochlorotrichaceae cyanobacterium]|jgi:pimeloyl-ACP methyl ester carboxylesterase